MIGVGILGYGFMGKTHAQAYAASGLGCRVVAVCDRKPASLPGTRHFTRAADLLADPEVRLVSICTPTDTHVELATAALRADKHVLLEKPVALDPAPVRELARLADAQGLLCMPAMCMRFWPGWDWLRDRVREQTYGRVLSATFRRLAPMPAWGGGFFADTKRSGGMLYDLHVHDTDFVTWCFGRPSGVATHGSEVHLTTAYRFADGPPHVTAEGAWDLAPGAGFRMEYLVVCERATLEFVHGREQPLVVYGAQRGEPVPLPPGTGYDAEVREIVTAIASGRRELRATLREAADVLEVLRLEGAGR
jgi:predicted dehydrogenase